MSRPRDIDTFRARQRFKRANRRMKFIWTAQIEAIDAALDGAPTAMAKMSEAFAGSRITLGQGNLRKPFGDAA